VLYFYFAWLHSVVCANVVCIPGLSIFHFHYYFLLRIFSLMWDTVILLCRLCVWLYMTCFVLSGCFFLSVVMPPRQRVEGHINLHLSVRSSVRPLVCPTVGYRYMVCPAVFSYRFRAIALIFCRIFIHIMEVCISTGCWFSSNIVKLTGSWT